MQVTSWKTRAVFFCFIPFGLEWEMFFVVDVRGLISRVNAKNFGVFLVFFQEPKCFGHLCPSLHDQSWSRTPLAFGWPSRWPHRVVPTPWSGGRGLLARPQHGLRCSTHDPRCVAAGLGFKAIEHRAGTAIRRRHKSRSKCYAGCHFLVALSRSNQRCNTQSDQ